MNSSSVGLAFAVGMLVISVIGFILWLGLQMFRGLFWFIKKFLLMLWHFFAWATLFLGTRYA